MQKETFKLSITKSEVTVSDVSTCSSAFSVIMVSTNVRLTLAAVRRVHQLQSSGHVEIAVMYIIKNFELYIINVKPKI